MPKIIHYTPGWLCRPSPGFEVFNTSQSKSPQLGSGTTNQQRNGTDGGDYVGPNRTIAKRGTEVFIAAGKQIRWTDLVSLKSDFEDQSRSPSKKPKPTTEARPKKENEGPEDLSYRILKVAIGEQIRQLSVSPNGNLIAIATSHTVHIAILPDSSHLGQIPNTPLKLKLFTVGETAHVLSRSQVTNILWHPCGAGGNTLVTITADAILRLWEFDPADPLSRSSPSLGIDLKKLVIASSEEDDVGPDDFRKNRGFSSENVDLEVASACFGDYGSDHESGWSAMTLWIAMRGGDIYALCPLLPSKWQPSATLIPSFSSIVMAIEASKEMDESHDLEDSRQKDDQLKWIRNLDGQDPYLLDSDDESSPLIYDRPPYPGAIPRLQGPFQTAPDIDDSLELSDIHAIAPKIDPEKFENEEDLGSEVDWEDEDGLSVAVIVLMTRSGKVFVCLDLEGVEGQWLPRKKPKRLLPPPPDPYLVVLEGLDTLRSTKEEANQEVKQEDWQWPSLSQDVNSRYTLFATHNNGVFYFSFDSWIPGVEKELQSSQKSGAPLRIELIKNGSGTLRESILKFDEGPTLKADRTASTSLIFQDSDLGHFLLTSINGHPQAATFDQPYDLRNRALTKFDRDDEEYKMPDLSLLNLGPVRTIYQPPDAFYTPSSLPLFLERNVHSRHKRMVKEEIRLSTATLDLMTQAHRVLSEETHRLGLAASDLFRRCERLCGELSDQISRANEVAQRVEKVAGEDADPYLETIKRKTKPSTEERLLKVQSRQGELTKRYDALRQKFSKLGGGRALSEKEKLWISDIDAVHNEIRTPPNELDDENERQAQNLLQRRRIANELSKQLLAHAQESSQNDRRNTERTDAPDDDIYNIPNNERQKKLVQVMKLLDTQTNLVDEAQLRLQRLNDVSA